MEDRNSEKATLGAGCFWCVEAVFQDLKGVHKVKSGYTGGEVENPTYRKVCSGSTGHAEVAQITFNPSVLSYDELLTVFWHTHNPTTKNRQGADVGTQYRSAIFYHSDEQKEVARQSKKETDQSDLWNDTIVTEIEPLDVFYEAEADHQNYYKNNAGAGYCSFVIAPKMKKLHKEFSHLLKDEATA
jgi:peptide-methionine (S)-S-oxide reductase